MELLSDTTLLLLFSRCQLVASLSVRLRDKSYQLVRHLVADTVNSRMNHYERVESLAVNYEGGDMEELDDNFMSRLLSLEIIETSNLRTLFSTLKARCPSLTSLSISRSRYTEIEATELPATLTTLHVSCFDIRGDVLKACPHLTDYNRPLTFVPDKMEKMLYYIQEVGDVTVSSSSLISLTVGRDSIAYMKANTSFNCPNLTRISIEFRLGTADLRTLVTNCPLLTTLGIQSVENLAESVNLIRRLQRLTTLSLASWQNKASDTVLVHRLPRSLMSLDTSRCAALVDFRNSNSSLVRLDCYEVTGMLPVSLRDLSCRNSGSQIGHIPLHTLETRSGYLLSELPRSLTKLVYTPNFPASMVPLPEMLPKRLKELHILGSHGHIPETWSFSSLQCVKCDCTVSEKQRKEFAGRTIVDKKK